MPEPPAPLVLDAPGSDPAEPPPPMLGEAAVPLPPVIPSAPPPKPPTPLTGLAGALLTEAPAPPAKNLPCGPVSPYDGAVGPINVVGIYEPAPPFAACVGEPNVAAHAAPPPAPPASSLTGTDAFPGFPCGGLTGGVLPLPNKPPLCPPPPPEPPVPPLLPSGLPGFPAAPAPPPAEVIDEKIELEP